MTSEVGILDPVVISQGGRVALEHDAPSRPGLMHVKFGEYHLGDVEFVAAFDAEDNRGRQDFDVRFAFFS